MMQNFVEVKTKRQKKQKSKYKIKLCIPIGTSARGFRYFQITLHRSRTGQFFGLISHCLEDQGYQYFSSFFM